MALSQLIHNNTTGDYSMGLASDVTTGEHGIIQRLTNGTGAPTVRGMLVSQSLTQDLTFVAQSSEFGSFGVVAEAGVEAGAECWVWTSGSVAAVLWENGKSATRGYLAMASPVDGRAYNVQTLSVVPVQLEGFKKIGSVLESKSSGTDIMVLCHLNFN